MRSRNYKRHLAALGGVFVILLALARPMLPAAASPPSQNSGEQIEAILAALSLHQKVAQMFLVSIWGQTLPLDGQKLLMEYQPGGVILFDYNTGPPEQVTALTNAMQNAILAGGGVIPAWIAIDEEGGTVSRLSDPDAYTRFPVPMAIAATDNPDYARAIGAAMAEELRAVGITMNLAPVADVETNPDNPVIHRRSFGSDPEQVGAMVAATIDGLQSGGVMATAKHFPGHGETGEDSHVTLPVVEADRARLEAVELAPFRAAIAAGAGAILAAHIWYPALEPAPDTPASLSPAVLSDLLRQEMSYDGLIMTDALDMDAIDTRYDLSTAAILAIQAGADLIAPGPHVGLEAQQAAIEAVIAAVEDGTIAPERIDDSVRRILRQKAAFNILDWAPLDPANARERVNRAAHEALVADVLAAAVTLVYDRTGRIPFGPEDRVALIYPATMPGILQSCRDRHANLWPVGVSAGPTDEERAWAISAVLGSDIAVVLSMDAAQNPPLRQLIQALPPEKTLVVAMRSPYDWQVFPDIAGYLASYSPLPPVIPAICNALFGRQALTGRLPVTLSSDLPAGTGIQHPISQ